MPVWRSTLPRTENGCGSSGHGSWFSLLAYHQKKGKRTAGREKTVSVDRRTCGGRSGNDHLWRCGDPHGNPIQWGTLLENL